MGGSDGGDGGPNGNGGDASNGGGGSDGGTSAAEKAVMAVSVTFTALLLAYVLWQAVTATSVGAPEARVLGTTTMESGDVRVHVEVTNPQDVGLETVIVEANCDTPPPDLTVGHVPAAGREEGYLVCPSGATNPDVSVSAWQEA